ncbi:MAG: hypothetical protein ACOX2K_00910 [Bacillota bacterium]
MSSKKPRAHEQLSADIERWQLEMASELGIVEEVRGECPAMGRHPLLRSHHFHKPAAESPKPGQTDSPQSLTR